MLHHSATRENLTVAELYDHERLAVPALEARGPAYVAAYLTAVPQARRATMQRLMSAMAREGIGTRSAPLGGEVAFGGLRAWLLTANAAGRLALGGPVGHDGSDLPVEDPVTAARLLAEAGTFTGYSFMAGDLLCTELADSVRNHALALAGAAMRTARLRSQAAQRGIHTTLDWVREQSGEFTEFSPHAFFEQWVIEGDPLHPCAMVRAGMSPAEQLGHGPEWGSLLAAPLAAVRRERAAGSGVKESFGELLRSEHPLLTVQAAAGLRQRGLAPDRYVLIPVHPLQASRVLPDVGRAAIRDGEIVPLPEIALPAMPLMSVRTLAPLGTEQNPHPLRIKTALEVQVAGAMRGIGPEAVHNGPRVSRVLREIMLREADFTGRLQILEDRAGIGWLPADQNDPRRARALGAILRTNPEQGLPLGRLAIPAAALTARSPLNDEPILAELLDELAIARSLPGRAVAAQLFAARYAELTVEPLFTLLTRYGIALAAHPQNSIVVFRDGLPVRFAVRDFGSIRIHRGRLRRQGLDISLRTGSSILAETEDPVRGKLLYTFLTQHVGALLECLAEVSSVDETRLWSPFRGEVLRTYSGLLGLPDIGHEASDDRRAVLDRPLPLKKVLSMRLVDTVADEVFLPAPNPLRIR
ncbi:hypothetical protein D5S17_16760 [Pseudonocardiaceae bacterium YIM PH 21723]|nr:hypothetical protein D5S17_16760 [Pseudonocardiaceae bacterium YIM PH 21723]